MITGGASGFGREFARRLAERGERIVLWDANAEALEETRMALPIAHVEVVDVRDPAAAAAAAHRSREAAGALGHLVNSAGVLRIDAAEEMVPNDYKLMMDVNYLGTVHVVQALLPHLEECASAGGDATLLLIASVAGLRGYPQLAGYCASKFAVIGFAEALRVELAARPFDVRLLCPPPGDTPMLATLDSLPPVYRLSRLYSADEVVSAALRGLEGSAPVIMMDAASRLNRLINPIAPGVVDGILRLAEKL